MCIAPNNARSSTTVSSMISWDSVEWALFFYDFPFKHHNNIFQILMMICSIRGGCHTLWQNQNWYHTDSAPTSKSATSPKARLLYGLFTFKNTTPQLKKWFRQFEIIPWWLIWKLEMILFTLRRGFLNSGKAVLERTRLEYANVCLNTGRDVIHTSTKTSYVRTSTMTSIV